MLKNLTLLLLVFVNVLAGTLTIPVIRPLMAAIGAPEHLMHAFVGANMLGAALGAPWLALKADKSGARRQIVILLSLIDAALLFACTAGLPVWLLLAARAAQGAASVGALSVLMGQVTAQRTSRNHGGGAASSGGAVVLAIALGPALGTLLIRMGGVYAPFAGAGLCALAVAIGSYWSEPVVATPRTSRATFREVFRSAPMLWMPTLWITAERFSVGCFVVTFSLFAHNVLGASDARVGTLLTCFMLPFACTMGPLGKLIELVGRTTVLAVGGVVYAGCFLALGHSDGVNVVWVLVAMGTASSAVYAPALCLTASLAPPHLRSTAMALGNAGGTLGMLLGTITAGVLTSMLRQRGVPADEMYQWIFRAGAAGPIGALLVSASALLAIAREDVKAKTVEGSVA